MKYKKTNCIVCNKKFERAESRVNTGMGKGLRYNTRRSDCKTCSKKCSRDYSNMSQKERKELNPQTKHKEK